MAANLSSAASAGGLGAASVTAFLIAASSGQVVLADVKPASRVVQVDPEARSLPSIAATLFLRAVSYPSVDPVIVSNLFSRVPIFSPTAPPTTGCWLGEVRVASAALAAAKPAKSSA